MSYTNIPTELWALRQWVGFMLVNNPERGKPDKVPINPRTLRGASSSRPNTWTALEEAAAKVHRTGTVTRNGERVSGEICGVGFMFNAGGIVGIDFDHCVEDGHLLPSVEEWVRKFDSYTEYSPSRTGIHIFCKGTLGGRKAVKTATVEIYDRARYFTVTGEPYGDKKPLREAQEILNALYTEYGEKATDSPMDTIDALEGDSPLTDDEVIERILRSKLAALWEGDWSEYPSQSEADMALCNELAFYCCRNTEQMDRLFRQSGLLRDKWDRRSGSSTYGEMTLEKAASDCKKVYDPTYNGPTAEQDFAAYKRTDYTRISAECAANIDFALTPDIRFYVDGVLAQGVTFLNAFSKVGKSRMTLQMLLEISRGRPFLGRKSHRCDVLYLALEDERIDFEKRLKAFLQGEHPPRNLYYVTKEQFDYDTPALGNGLLEFLDAQLKAHPGIGVIAIDVFGIIRSKRQMNEDFAMHERRDIDALIRFTAQHDGLAILIAHHVSKAGLHQSRSNATGSGAGSYVISGTVHAEMEIALDPENEHRARFSVKGRRMPASSFAIRDEYPFWRLLGDWEAIKLEEDPLVATAKWLIKEYGSWRGSATEFYEINSNSRDLPPFKKAKLNKNDFEKRAKDLLKVGIRYAQRPNGKGAPIHEFKPTDGTNC